MEKVAHRVNENHFWLFGAQRLIDPVGTKNQIKTMFKWMVFDPPETLGKALSITVIAARADLRATGHRVPREIRPFNRRILGHHASQ